ncbi:hypothetical protein GN956_G6727 [Arapaima gigas]
MANKDGKLKLHTFRRSRTGIKNLIILTDWSGPEHSHPEPPSQHTPVFCESPATHTQMGVGIRGLHRESF